MRGDIEDVKHELAILLVSASFAAALADVDAEKATTRATPVPKVIYESERLTLSGQGFPVGELLGKRTTYSSSDAELKTALHEVDILWTQNGDNELVITQDLERLVRATRDLLWPPTGPISLHALASGPIELIAEEYTALMPNPQHGPFIKGSATTIRVLTLTL